MKIKILSLALIFLTTNLFAQTQKKGFIIEIDGSNIYLDYTSSDVKIGDHLQIISEQKVMIHPVTKERIVTKGEILATLEITDTQNTYSIAGRIFPSNAMTKIKVGLSVLPPNTAIAKESPKDGKINVSIAEAKVNDAVGVGYFGNYVSDLLMSELLNCDKIRLIDRSLLDSQIDETNLSESGYLNSNNSIVKGQIAGVQYIIQVTMQRPDVTNITSGIPLHSILTVAGAVANVAGASSGIKTGFDIAGMTSSNIKKSRLKAAVSITARVVDVQTGEILFMCSSKGKSEGESQLSLEEGALNGMQINGGVEGFKQTVTGKAIALAYRNIGNSLKDYFNGKTTQKVVTSGLMNSEMTWRKGSIYMGVTELSKSDMRETLSENPQLYFNYAKGKSQRFWGGILMFGCTPAAIGSLIFVQCSSEEFSTVRFFGGACICCGIGYLGYYLNQSGKINIIRSMKSYNQKLKQTNNTTPNLNLGFSSGGLALTYNF